MDAPLTHTITFIIGALPFFILWRNAVESARADKSAIKSYQKALNQLRKRAAE